VCMEDIKIGREVSSNIKRTAVAAGSAVEIAPANPKRVALLVSSDNTADIFIGPEMLPPTATGGIALTIGVTVQRFRVEDIGTLITQRWFAFSPAGTKQVTVIDSELGRNS
jgi:hypothetical protein